MFSRRTDWKLSPNRYTQTVEEARAAGGRLLDLTASNPTTCGVRYDTNEIVSAFQNPQSLSYEPEPKGLLAAREQVARYYRDDHGLEVDVNSLVLTTSTSEAYSYAFRLLCNPGDEVLVAKPSYPLFEFLGDLQDVKLVPYFLQYAHGWFIDFPSLMAAVTPQTKAILLVHPNNPTGSYVKEEERERLNEVCREHDLALIVDEVFLDYPLDGRKRRSFVENRDALTFTMSGLSKIAGLPQMKVAWMMVNGPESLVGTALDRLEVIADTYLSLNSPTQWAFPALMAQRHSIQRQLRDRVLENWTQLRIAAGNANPFELAETEGGWYAVLRISSDRSDEELAIELVEKEQVLVHPGHFYDFPSGTHLVLSLIAQPEEFRAGATALLQLLRRQSVEKR